jgi:spore maturation protein CgeB
LRINLIGAFIRNNPFGTEIAFKKGLERLGTHTITCIDPYYPNQEWDYDADATILFKWMDNYWHDLGMCRGKKIVYQPDDLRFPHIQQMMRDVRKFCDFAFTFDDDGARLAVEYGYKKAERLLLTADDTLYRPLPDVEKDIDVCFIGSLTGGGNHRSRVKMCNIVNSMPGVLTYFNGSVYDLEQLNLMYNRSKIILNHATDVGQEFGHGYGYQCRHFEAGMTRSCVLSNVVDNERCLSQVQEFASEAELQGKIRYLLANDDIRKAAAQGLYSEIMMDHKPEHRAIQMINFIEAL